MNHKTILNKHDKNVVVKNGWIKMGMDVSYGMTGNIMKDKI